MEYVAEKSPESNSDPFKASLLLMCDVSQVTEDQRKASAYTHSSDHRDGLDSISFLFDVANEAQDECLCVIEGA